MSCMVIFTGRGGCAGVVSFASVAISSSVKMPSIVGTVQICLRVSSTSQVGCGRNNASRWNRIERDLIDAHLGLSYKYRDGRERRFSVFFRWVLTWFTGFLTALAGIVLLFCTQHISILKRQVMEHYINTPSSSLHIHEENDSRPLVYGVLLGINVGLVSIAAILTIFVEPVAAGSGISEIKSMLNGMKIPRMLRFRTLCCKLIGTICSVAGGLPVGKEGPMIHRYQL
ncbi:hypothetical protein DYB35_012009 [Aphanomyces astaci]|uniref:Chloride channel protein n=1 Tax=Aphanomyces astaci TaxID=112090 RepID=A0A3R6ZD75_APHAT|nr:hypothetical protein DYB35_012009 [Aphanomyces astaci]